MNKLFYKDVKLGILGGGQLGRMLLRSCVDLNVHTAVMDPDEAAPSRPYCNEFVCADFGDYDSVYDFGKNLDVLTIEIEEVNVDALRALEADGVMVRPSPDVIALIQDKGEQKAFYLEHGVPTTPYDVVENRAELLELDVKYPAVQKLRRAGYDGRGVMTLAGPEAAENAFDAPSIIEDRVNILKEISVVVARNAKGEVKTYPPVEMAFHPEANLAEYIFAPAGVSPHTERACREISQLIAEQLDLVGVLAVELFLDFGGNVWVNEAAPRPHNSGHHTIEANITSQFEQHLRAILDLPLGNCSLRSPAAMINILGAEGYEGEPIYEGVEQVMSIEGVKIHLYGKKETRPFRKMGHITVIDKDPSNIRAKTNLIRQILKVTA